MRLCLGLLGQDTLGRMCLSGRLIPQLVFAYLKGFTALWGMAKKISTSGKVATKSMPAIDVSPQLVAYQLLCV
jgi:hypothetical protein